MKIICIKKHMYLDFLVVIAFAVAPMLIDLEGIAVVVSLALALVHALVTLLTFTPGIAIISTRVHGWIEFAVAPIIGSLPWVLGFMNHTTSVIFFVGLALSIFIVWALTDYEQPA